MSANDGYTLSEPKKKTLKRESLPFDYIFEWYNKIESHEYLIRDSARTEAYMRAIDINRETFKDKVVLDIGCGLGLMSLFAAKAGAKKVIGVDFADVTELTKKIIKDNKYENVICILKQRLEDVDLNEEVDIILHEGMGYNLFHLGSLDLTLYARDKWLKPNGAIYPGKVELYIAAVDCRKLKQEHILFWEKCQHGIKLNALKETALSNGFITSVHPKEIVSDGYLLQEFDLKTHNGNFGFSSEFEIMIVGDNFVHAFVTYFVAEFEGPRSVIINTSPFNTKTHWKQTVFFIKESIPAMSGESIFGNFTLSRNEQNPRDLDITISYNIKGKHIVCSESNRYKMR
ncbi:hypothetical protein O3M35_003883 [Rhynocoris fuscipes]|uniref:type I protein arginine methyltransferase n=1 Tax=Rhynocoris fuscipes TaxID=488301 RepID=A0AAW1CHZ1_9HEMI